VDAGLLLQGVILGFSIAAPVGPIGVLCIRRTLAEGRAAGLVSGLGAATADAVYGGIAGLGLGFVSDMLIGRQTWLRLIGGVFLIYLGVATILSRPAEPAAPAAPNRLAGAYASTFLLTLTNPMTILFFAGVMAGVGVGSAAGGYATVAVFVVGVFAGSALWWLTLSGIVGVMKGRMDARALVWVNRVSGVIIAAFGVLALASWARLRQ
jgi:threonine/homoserine/homoserine lactone efflux protein